ncbi:radical SAM protein [Erythrobacter jejuensis]|uniref:Radical SAM protein n=1 Tax=Parerythrobacter jejuensis TaxID=795812 RepID=A0A845AQI9_9SPHN|nr:radical SAM protein [Parerythrobacter jejuensis]
MEGAALPEEKFADPDWTAKGEPRASVPLTGLETLWLNTGTLCNLACANCYIESSPTNDALIYLSHAHAATYLDEVADKNLGTREIAFTGGEPFMNPDFVPMLSDVLERGFEALVLSNAMKPMRRYEAALLELRERFGNKLTLRISLDHHSKAVHEAERGPRSWDVAMDGLRWLSTHGFSLAVAGRLLPGESEAEERAGYARLFAAEQIAVDAHDPLRLVLFPEMDEDKDIAEITTACWQILDQDPAQIMCASSRMVVHRKGEETPRVAACTLIPYDEQFDMGATLAEASQPVKLNHPHCARFCVLGGASCTA